MADARSLLRAKKAEERVNHPLASYLSGQLKCTICGTLVKNASVWDGHLGTKAHRNNVLRVKEEQRLREHQEQQGQQEQEQQEQQVHAVKRVAVEQDNQPAKKRKKADSGRDDAKDTAIGEPGPVPSNFFSDPNRVLPASLHDSDEDDEETPVVPAPSTISALDLEWESFQRTVLNAPTVEEVEDTRQETFQRATVFAEPQLFEELPEGFPSTLARQTAGDTEAAKVEQPPEETPEETRKRKEQEEKELIMDRILDEERAQEEADGKVAALKARLDLIRRQRQVTRKAKDQ